MKRKISRRNKSKKNQRGGESTVLKVIYDKVDKDVAADQSPQASDIAAASVAETSTPVLPPARDVSSRDDGKPGNPSDQSDSKAKTDKKPASSTQQPVASGNPSDPVPATSKRPGTPKRQDTGTGTGKGPGTGTTAIGGSIGAGAGDGCAPPTTPQPKKGGQRRRSKTKRKIRKSRKYKKKINTLVKKKSKIRKKKYNIL